MPKLKTHRGTAKRIKRTANDILLRHNAGTTHFKEKKRSARKRSLATASIVKGRNAFNIKKALGV